jgi:hypothetical protein
MDYTFYSGRSLRLGKERSSLLLRQQQQALLPRHQGFFGFGMNPLFQQHGVRVFAARSRSNSFTSLPLAPPASPFRSSPSLSSLVTPVASSLERRLSWTADGEGGLFHESLSPSERSLPFSEVSVESACDNDSSSYSTAAPTQQVLSLRQQVRDLRLQLETQELESTMRRMQYEEQITTLQSTCREQQRMLEVLKGAEGTDRDWHDRLRMTSLSGNESVEEEKKGEDADAESYVVEESQDLARKQSSMIDEMQTELDASDSAMDALLEEIDALQRRQRTFLSLHSKRPDASCCESATNGFNGSPTKPDKCPHLQPEQQADGSVLQLRNQIATLQEEREEYKNRLARETEKTKVAMNALAVTHDRISSFEQIVTTFRS